MIATCERKQTNKMVEWAWRSWPAPIRESAKQRKCGAGCQPNRHGPYRCGRAAKSVWPRRSWYAHEAKFVREAVTGCNTGCRPCAMKNTCHLVLKYPLEKYSQYFSSGYLKTKVKSNIYPLEKNLSVGFL